MGYRVYNIVGINRTKSVHLCTSCPRIFVAYWSHVVSELCQSRTTTGLLDIQFSRERADGGDPWQGERGEGLVHLPNEKVLGESEQPPRGQWHLIKAKFASYILRTGVQGVPA